MSSGSTGGGRGGDAKTIISPNTSFSDIIMCPLEHHHKWHFHLFMYSSPSDQGTPWRQSKSVPT